MLSLDSSSPSMEERAFRGDSELRKEDDAFMALQQISSLPESGLILKALEQERNERQAGEGSLRQLTVWLEEQLARESVALRKENAEMRTTLGEALKMVADRQADSVEAARRQNDFQAWAEENRKRLEAVESMIHNLEHEHNFEKAKNSAQARELTQAVTQTRDFITQETTGRRSEVGLVVRGLDEVRDGLVDLTSNLEKTEARLQEQLLNLDRTLVDEVTAREARDRKALGERSELSDAVQHLANMQTELEVTIQNAVNEERRLREQAVKLEEQAREEVDAKLAATMQELMTKEAAARDKDDRMLERRVVSLESGRMADVNDREEFKRTSDGRMTTMKEDLGEARNEIRKLVRKCDDFAALRETLRAETTSRQAQERSLELAIQEQEAKFDANRKAREQVERRLESKCADLGDRLDSEASVRNGVDAKYAQQISDLAQEVAVQQQKESRRIEDLITTTEKAFGGKLAEERGLREKSCSILEQKDFELREGIDEVRKWRVEQYNELVFELTKLQEMITEEAKARQQQDQILEGTMNKMREETSEEVNTRKYAINAVQEEIKDVLSQLISSREALEAKDEAGKRFLNMLQNDIAAEANKREVIDQELRQALDKEASQRDEMVRECTRSWQAANTKTNQDWRATLRSDANVREESALRLGQQIVDLRTKIEELRTLTDQQKEEVRLRFEASQEALQLEEASRKTEDLLLKRDIEQLTSTLQAEQLERSSSDQHAVDRLATLDSQLRDEALLREENERRVQKDLLELQARLQAEQVAREEHDIALEQGIKTEVMAREDSMSREIKSREDGDAAVTEAWQRNFREEQSLRERDRKEMVTKLQQLQAQLQEEHEEIVDSKAAFKKEAQDREVSVTKVAALVREETQKREDALEREERARQEAQQRALDSMNLSLRDERRLREKEIMRIESSRAIATAGGTPIKSMTMGSSGDTTEVLNLQMENRTIKSAMSDLQDRLSATEMRQKSAEERTVSMLDTIMSGLTSPGD